MKHLSAFYILFILLTACNHRSDDKVVKTKIDARLTAWHLAASQADFDTYFSMLDKDAVYVGTAKEEVWSKQAFMDFSKPYFDKGKAWDFKKITRNVYLFDNQNYASFDETLHTWMGVCRGSGVLQYKNGKWLIKHYVLSLTVPNDKVQSVIKTIASE